MSSQVLAKQTNKNGAVSMAYLCCDGYSSSVVIVTTKPGSSSMTAKPMVVPKEKMRETMQKIYEGIPLEKHKNKKRKSE